MRESGCFPTTVEDPYVFLSVVIKDQVKQPASHRPLMNCNKDCCRFAMTNSDFHICTRGTATNGTLFVLQKDIILNICWNWKMDYTKSMFTTNKMHYVRFDVLKAVTMKNVVFWDVAPCSFCVNRLLALCLDDIQLNQQSAVPAKHKISGPTS
jgi:hypothetical protein